MEPTGDMLVLAYSHVKTYFKINYSIPNIRMGKL
jgi:hypothetical protein